MLHQTLEDHYYLLMCITIPRAPYLMLPMKEEKFVTYIEKECVLILMVYVGIKL